MPRSGVWGTTTRRRWLVALATAFTVAAAGCATTGHKAAPGGGGSSRLGSGGGPGPAVPLIGGATASGSKGGVSASARGQAATGSGAGVLGGGPGASSSAGGAPAAVPGATPAGGTIQVGFFYPNDGGAAYAAFGVKSQSGTSASLVDAVNRLTDDINQHGGLGGRKMVLVLHGAPLVTSETWDAQGQAACSAFTEDHKVFAAILEINGTVSVSECLASRHVVVLESRNVVYDRYEYQRTSPYVYSADGLDLSRQGPWLDELARGGYFDKGAKLGVITEDDTTHSRSIAEVVRPTLRSHGVAIADVVALSAPQATADASAMAAQAGNAVLKFKTEGIDHVIFWGTEGVGPFFFPTAAENQQYRPRYGISTYDYPELNRRQAPAAQWHRAMGAGWSGAGDVGMPPNWTPNALAQKCLKIFSDVGLAPTTGDTASAELGLCDTLWLLKTGLDRASAATPEAFRVAIDGLGTSVVAARGTPISWGPGKYDGAAAVRRFAFDDGCSCFKWASPTWTPAP